LAVIVFMLLQFWRWELFIGFEHQDSLKDYQKRYYVRCNFV